MRCRGVLSVIVNLPEMHIPPWYWFSSRRVDLKQCVRIGIRDAGIQDFLDGIVDDGVAGRLPVLSIPRQVRRLAGGGQEDVVLGEVGVGIGQSAAVAGELVAVLLREGLVFDGDQGVVVLIQDQDIQVAPLSVDNVLPLLADLGGDPIRIEQPWRSHCRVEQGDDEVRGLPVVRRWVQKPADDPGVEFLGGPAAGRDEIKGVQLLAFLGDGVAEGGEGIQQVR